MTGSAAAELEHLELRERARLTTRLVDQRRYGVPEPEVTTKLIAEVRIARALSVASRANRLLRFFSDASEYLGEEISFESETASGYEILAVSESLEWQEITFLLDDLAALGLLKVEYFVGDNGRVTVTVGGYERLRELEESGPLVSQGFVAMWFDTSMNEPFSEVSLKGFWTPATNLSESIGSSTTIESTAR